jgi:nuclear-control-of-ATPase protein 2
MNSLSRGVSSTTEEAGLATNGPEQRLISLLLHKAAIQTYALALNAILEQTLETSRHIWYWDDVLYSRRLPILGLNLSSPVGLYIYWIQTAPQRLYAWSGLVLEDVKRRTHERDLGLSVGWKRFYGLVKEVVRERSLLELQKRAMWLSPAARARNEVESRKKELKKAKEVGSNAIGLLLGEGLGDLGEVLDQHHQDSGVSSLAAGGDAALKRSISLLDSVISVTSGRDEEQPEDIKSLDVDGFESRISTMTKDSNSTLWTSSDPTEEISIRLQSILSTTMVQYQSASKARLATYGRPSRLIRYWLPTTLAVLSSSTLLRIFVNRREDIMTWIRELGQTTIAFWENWVLEPTKRIIGTIKHDSASEIAIMSKKSLEGDRESLERMVVDFAVDTNSSMVGSKLNDVQIQDIRMKVREGDMTPVLMAYEKDLQRPVMGAVRGNLIRAVLIQVQKTKVDVEVAMGGIDSLLKSQELVFG